MKWYEGHNWKVELDYKSVGRVEFKFVVKVTHDNSTYNVGRWEGGHNKNHIFD